LNQQQPVEEVEAIVTRNGFGFFCPGSQICANRSSIENISRTFKTQKMLNVENC